MGTFMKVFQIVLGLGTLLFRGLGYVCIMIAISLICGTIFVYFHTVLPLVVDLQTAWGAANFVLASWLSFNLIFNYALVVTTPPGFPPEVEGTQDVEAQAQTPEGRWSRVCKRCHNPKPARAHHCSICNQCVLKMDHHCPWINQCVGHYNHRYFFLFVLYLWMACLYACATLGIYHASNGFKIDARVDTPITFTFVICGAVFIAMCVFLFWNTYLLLTNQTTIEFYYNRMQKATLSRNGELFCNPYDVGWTLNLQQVFGPFARYPQLLLPTTRPLHCDGIRWHMMIDV
eukprot:NODE_4615_length_1039_cov_89.391921_g4412_i0.p1 GENE.NODE_4615_length_1039_cov_89.391921_g4412_i0~~NODE_4615_length_1039_cov_89.391921_g4412_i0.p1  ORF type:complete len:288 (+),score=34.93 NODE_4615_length_1039_cov_89.391921_g4412_i0:100-963(+)